MAGMESSPVEPAKTHAALVGRGGVGNYQEARKWEGVPLTEPPVKIDPIDTKALHSTGRGGTGNFKQGPDETSTERSRRTSTSAKESEWASFGRGGAGNIEAAKIQQRKKDDEKARDEAAVMEKAKAHAKAAVEAIQVPKPARSAYPGTS